MRRKGALQLAAALAVGIASGAEAPAPDRIRLAINKENYANLPLFIAVDNGYFQQQNLDVVLVPYTGSSITQLPFLARGEVDITEIAPAPGLFNLGAEGFNVKVIASLSGAHTGWNGTSWLMVRQDLWDAKTIRKPSDLRGMHLDVAAAGAPTDLLAHEVIRQAGLTASDVNVTASVRTPPNWYTSLRNHAVDVQATIEPTSTEIERQGLAHKWLSYADGTPWFQDVYLAASSVFVRDHHDALRRFLIAYLTAARDIDRAGPVWSPKLAAVVAKWTQLPLATIMAVPGPAYTGLGAVNRSSLDRVQAYWVSQALVKNPESLNDLLDLTALEEARKALRIR